MLRSALRRVRLRPLWLLVGLLAVAVLLASAAPVLAAGGRSSIGRPARAACTTARVLNGWSPSRLAAQTVVVPVDAAAVASLRPQVAEGAGGIILFGTNVPTTLPSTLARLTVAAPQGIAPFVMVDEEGGAVQRAENLVGAVPSARTMAATMSAPAIEQFAKGLGSRLRRVGISMDLAPVLDLDGGPGPSATNPDGTRSFSPTLNVATADGIAFARGLLAAGVVPVFKHFPGLGGSSGNTDNTAASTLSWPRLEASGLVSFARGIAAGLPAVMVATAIVPGLTTVPASESAAVITGVLRSRLHFGGLVLTDSLSTAALTSQGFSLGHAVVTALGAGADMVLYNADNPGRVTAQVIGAITAALASGSLGLARLVDAVSHVLHAKGINLCTATAHG